MQNMLEDLKTLLAQDDRLTVDGEIMKNKVIELALQLDQALLKRLLSIPTIKKHFFQDIGGVSVFDKIKFQRFISNKTFLPDSYTAYKNKIGLVTADDEYISESKEVLLAWPYKDCVLEGGQTNETQKRNEIFWNEILAPDEIDRLLEPKVLINIKRYMPDKTSKVVDFKRDDSGVMKENLIIKGNNLLVLHSLKKIFRGKIKLVYIDPPFNTASAANTFSYNNSFNHSAWLTFMKNRIEVARELLSQNGIFVIAIDHYELFYLGVLCDEIFGRENRMGVISVVHNPGGRQDDAFFATAHENMIFYAKDIAHAKINTFGLNDEKMSQYIKRDEYGYYKPRGFRRSGNNSKREERPKLFYPIYYDPKTEKITLEKKEGCIEILPIDEQGIERCWRWGKETLIKKMDKYIEIKITDKKIDLYIKEREDDYEGEKPKTIWDKPKYTGQTATNELKKIFGEKVFSYPKSPYLMMDILKICTSDNDIIIDFFGGSGTTAHAALELNKEDGGKRQFIICEQMDYIEQVTRERVKKIIEINKKDDFIYCELAESNKHFEKMLQKAKTTKDLESIWQLMQKKAFLSYKIDIKKINETSANFKELSLDNQKKFLTEILDKNLLYINLADIEDKDFEISKEDKENNKKFYAAR